MNSITEDSERSEHVANDDHSKDGTDPDHPKRSLGWSFQAVDDYSALREMSAEQARHYSCGIPPRGKAQNVNRER